MNIQEFIKAKEEEFDEKFGIFWGRRGNTTFGSFDEDPSRIIVINSNEVKHFLSQSLLEYNEKIKEMVEKMDALTPVVDKCMSKVSDEAKVPKYGQNYLGREDVLKLITNLTQDTNPKE